MRPRDEADLAEAMRGADGPLRIVGGGTRALGAPSGRPLSVAGLSGVTLYEPGALTLVAGAGTPLDEVEAVVAAEGQRLAFEPPRMGALLARDGVSTIGGVVADNASGPRRVVAGACRDALIGVRFVDGAGAVVANGGRVMKNVTGYDLVKLMAGSRGTLGVLTEVAFKLLPAVEVVRDVVVPGLDARAAVTAMSAALGTPYEVTGAAWVGGDVRLRLEGVETSVAYRAGALIAALGRGEIDAAPDWTPIRDAAPMVGQGDLWRLSVRPSDAPDVLDRLCPERAMLDWGGGLIWVLCTPGTDVRGRMGVSGHATCLRGTAPARHPEAPAVARLADGVRARFDPRGILSPVAPTAGGA
ncbi:MAG: FAD-binding protein [Shimia sp.]